MRVATRAPKVRGKGRARPAVNLGNLGNPANRGKDPAHSLGVQVAPSWSRSARGSASTSTLRRAPVLRCLFSDNEVSPAVIEAILRHRNEEVPPSDEPQAEASALVDEGEQVKRKMFAEVQDLDEIPEFLNLGNPQTKELFYELTTTRSNVFTVHMASVFKRNEENRVFVIRRSASLLVRLEDGEEMRLHPIVLLEDRAGLRVVPIDFPDRYEDELRRLSDIDQFAKEERAWNPFVIDFYKPRAERN